MPNPEFMVELDYTNWKGERSLRVVAPNRIVFEHSAWHPEKQWVLYAYDVDRDAERGFAMKDVHSWKPFHG